jgi:6-pyruvoyl-tetrahydropterin synthase
MTEGFQVGTSVPFRAIHRLPWSEGSEREAHEHDYRIDVVVERPHLDEFGVVVNLDLVHDALEALVARLDGHDLDEAIAVGQAPGVTVEVLARWLHRELAEALRGVGASGLSVRVWETPDAFGGYAAALE